MYHLADGEEQRKRDSNLGAAATAPLPQNSWLYGHDVEAEFAIFASMSVRGPA
jgi:hypothetical protein